MERNQVETRLKWKIEDMFESVTAWQTEYDDVDKKIDFSSFVGKLGDKKEFKKYNEISDELSKRLERLYVYAMMTVDTDARSSEAPTLVNTLSTIPILASRAGTKEPICAIIVIIATWRI